MKTAVDYPFMFEPKQLDVSGLRELPAMELAKKLALPAVVLDQGMFNSQGLAERLGQECTQESER